MADDLPGVVFRLRGSEASKTHSGAFCVKVKLDAEVQDEALWNVVKKKLEEGLKIYTINDFKTELAEVLRGENVSLERKAAELNTAYRNLLEKHKKLTEEANKMRNALSALSSELWDQELGEPDTER